MPVNIYLMGWYGASDAHQPIMCVRWHINGCCVSGKSGIITKHFVCVCFFFHRCRKYRPPWFWRKRIHLIGPKYRVPPSAHCLPTHQQQEHMKHTLSHVLFTSFAFDSRAPKKWKRIKINPENSMHVNDAICDAPHYFIAVSIWKVSSVCLFSICSAYLLQNKINSLHALNDVCRSKTKCIWSIDFIAFVLSPMQKKKMPNRLHLLNLRRAMCCVCVRSRSRTERSHSIFAHGPLNDS